MVVPKVSGNYTSEAVKESIPQLQAKLPWKEGEGFVTPFMFGSNVSPPI